MLLEGRKREKKAWNIVKRIKYKKKHFFHSQK